jgi:hypothetical protein
MVFIARARRRNFLTYVAPLPTHLMEEVISMKRKRLCRKCWELFLPDPRSYRPTKEGRKVSTQHYCSKPECRQESHRRSQHIFWKHDSEVRARNVVACRSWRANHKDYWWQRREKDPAYTKRNVELQRRRDRGDLANTDSIGGLWREKLDRIGILIHLANTDPMKISWPLVSEEIRLLLRWLGRLANTNSIASHAIDKPQSPA